MYPTLVGRFVTTLSGILAEIFRTFPGYRHEPASNPMPFIECTACRRPPCAAVIAKREAPRQFSLLRWLTAPGPGSQ
jgi:hypothetical protein